MTTETTAQPATDRPWDTAEDWSMWEITGTYPTKPGHGKHSFTACLAVVLPGFTHGGDRPLFSFVGPLAHINDVIDPGWITDARPLLLVDRADPTQAYWEHDQQAVDDGLGRAPKGVCVCDAGPGDPVTDMHRPHCRADETAGGADRG